MGVVAACLCSGVQSGACPVDFEPEVNGKFYDASFR